MPLGSCPFPNNSVIALNIFFKDQDQGVRLFLDGDLCLDMAVPLIATKLFLVVVINF